MFTIVAQNRFVRGGMWGARLLLIIPWATPLALSVIGWLWMFDSKHSPIDYLLEQIGLLGPAHYAANATGIVLQFEAVDRLDSPFLVARQVTYDDSPPAITCAREWARLMIRSPWIGPTNSARLPASTSSRGPYRRRTNRCNSRQLPTPLGTDGKIVADVTTTQGIGPVAGEFYVFDRDREVLRRLGDTRLMNDYLDRNGGVRVYRDGIRVYNYGEPGDDWLGLDLRRVNAPTRRISRNIILGAVHLSLEASDGLREKTNREGFIDNDTCARLRQIVLGAIGVLEAERRIDKERIRRITEQPSDALTAKIEKPILELRRALARKKRHRRFRTLRREDRERLSRHAGDAAHGRHVQAQPRRRVP